ncbi:hypothetical protein FH972_021263 [Carpinus fangiana]|uniref:Vacuolar import and degradation protein 21 n=1 Tax=Carpinus fangiana TaxID=176857 RepID=A0A5N6KPE7_9ROSI|nr:hypothetical protein FH972_021263 [Carpinus fangiana]
MSVDLSRENATISDTKRQIRKSILSRKRKLSELFQVTVNRGITRDAPEAPRDAPSLPRFLELNDIERDLYFNPSTLPAPALIFTESPPASPKPVLLNETSTTEVSSTPRIELPSHSDATTPFKVSSSNDDALHAVGDSAAAAQRPTSPPLAHTKSPAKVTQASNGIAAQSPRKSSHDRTAGVGGAEVQSQQQQLDAASSPSSSAAQHSTNTSRTGGGSPATSPEDEASRQAHAAASHELLQEETEGAKAPHGNAERPRASRSSVNFNLTSSAPAQSSSRPSQPLSPSSSRAATQDDEAIDLQSPTKTRTEPTQILTPASSAAPDDMRRESQAHDHSDRMDVDARETSQKPKRPAVSRAVLEPITSSRVHTTKKRKRDSHVKLSLVVDKYEDAAAKPATSSLRPHEVPQHPGKLRDPKDDYMYLLFHKEALDKAYKRDLHALLAHSAKTLTTAEWMAGHQEKQDCMIIKKVYDLQQKGVWSLRQKKPEPEPKRPLTHQDYLLRHVKWLQTDFREERKLKAETLRQLAVWCAEFVAASPDERLALRVKTNGEQDQQGHIKSESNESVGTSDKLLENLPAYRLDDSVLRSTKRLKIRHGHDEREDLGLKPLTDYDLDPDAVLNDDLPPAAELPPDDDSCALFNPENKQLRARVNIQWPFKPPTGPDAAIPPQAFFENRRESQWTHEDDTQLRGYVKDFPSNWHLIADRMAPRTKFPSTRDRRTPWECYERLLSMEAQPNDINTRQMVRQFQFRIEQARSRYTSSHAASIQQAQQQAQQNGQPAVSLQGPRFPTPIRVERRASNRRFLGLLDGARKLARRRETAAAKQQQQQAAHEAAAQVPKPARAHPPHTPAHMSKLKFEQQQSNLRRQEEQKARIRAMQVQAQQQARQTGNQALYNGIAQRMGNMPNPSATANGHLAVPGQGQNRAMQQQNGQMGLPNGAHPNGPMAAQLAASGRNQIALLNQQRLAPQMNGSASTGDQQNVQQLMQQQRSLQQFQQQQAAQQHRASPGMMNGVSNSNMNGAFNNHAGSGGEASQSPHLGQAVPDGQNQASPNMSQQMMASGSGQHRRNTSQTQPQQLSNGQVPVIYNLQHQIAMNNPQLSQDEVNLRAKAQLNHMMHQSRQNALNAASGVHAISSQSNNQMAMQPPNSNTTYSQNNGNGQQNFGQTGMLASNHSQGRSGSPANPNVQQQQQQQQQHYQQQLRQQMYNQSRIPGNSGMGSPINNAASPAMGNTSVNGVGFSGNVPRTTTPVSSGVVQNQGMRPPSRSASSMGMHMNGTPFDQQQRQGSAQIATPRLASQSPRPLSSQGQPT